MRFKGSLRLRPKASGQSSDLAGFGGSNTGNELDEIANESLNESLNESIPDQATRVVQHQRQDDGDYTDRLTKLFPVEGVTLFPMAMAIATDSHALLLGLTLVIAALIIALRYLGTQPQGGGSPHVPAIVVSLIAFLLYAFTLGAFDHYVFGEAAKEPDISQQRTLIGSFLTVIFTALLGAMKFALPAEEN